LIIVANAAVGKSWSRIAIGVLTGIVAGAIFLLGALELAGAPVFAQDLTGSARLGREVGTMATGFAAAALVAQPVRERLARILPINPENPVHALAVSLAVIMLGLTATVIAFTDVLATIQAQPPLSLGDLIIQEIPFLILGIAGVGLFIRRNVRDSAARLGLVVPAWWHLALALAAAGAFFVFAGGVDALSLAVTPNQGQRVQSVVQHVFGNLLTNPIAIVALAVVPGICEDVLFRGALQPRFGLLATAVLFAAIHTEYGLSFTLLGVFVLAIGLGLIRKYTNTTTSALCHATNNLLMGFGIAGSLVAVAIGAEVVLAGFAAYGLWIHRKRLPAQVAP
jgi:membrane protease YdiL (CAAX protease family)